MGIVKNEILSIGKYLQNEHLEIPYFQRPYKWTGRNVMQLIDDIQRFKSEIPYRIGTVVIHKENESERIVDGQQRTITFLLILKAIISKKYDNINDSLKKQISEINEQLFEPTFKSDISQKNIQNNYLSIIRRMDVIDDSFIDFFLNRCQITYFVIDDISEAFQFFDSQNARGRDLDPHDLLKAFHLREMHIKTKQVNEDEVTQIVETWENMDGKELAKLFAEFLYRVKGWSKGVSSRYFTKKDTDLFKGITLETISPYPYTKIYRYIDDYIQSSNIKSNQLQFPFQLDQTIVNGKYFFEMISYYKKLYDNLNNQRNTLEPIAKKIIQVLDTYEGKNRTGDKYVRMLFNCALLFYIDKFGEQNISKAIEKIFIWAYKIRLTYQNLQLVSVDNYVVHEFNIFRKIKEATFSKEIEMIELPLLDNDFESGKTIEIKKLFIKMNYYVRNK